MGTVSLAAVHRIADPPVPVLVDDNGGTWPGQVLGWRGDRVYVTYKSGIGLRHLTARLLCLLLRLSSKDRAVPPSLLAPAYGAAFRRTG